MTIWDGFFTFVIILAAIGSGIVGGIFFAFSNFVMRALARISTPSGIAAMQTINVTVLNPGFLGTFMGTAVLSGVLIVVAIGHWTTPVSPLLLLGGIAYVIGSFGVTVARNVPLNDSLARVSEAETSDTRWRDYVDRWTMWNHVRTGASSISALCFCLAIAVGG